MREEFADQLRRAITESVPPSSPGFSNRVLESAAPAALAAHGAAGWLGELVRHWLSVVAIGAIGAGAVIAGLVSQPQRPDLAVYAGYADTAGPTTHAGAPSLPQPWHPSGGSMKEYDGGAVRIDNLGPDDVTLERIWVQLADKRYELWGRNLTIPAHGSLQLTQTAVVNANPFEGNFDTSEASGKACAAPTNVLPVVHLETVAAAVDFVDNTQVLNTGGRDAGSCPGHPSEARGWTLLARN